MHATTGTPGACKGRKERRAPDLTNAEDSFVPPCGFWESNPRALEEQTALASTGASLQAPGGFYLYYYLQKKFPLGRLKHLHEVNYLKGCTNLALILKIYNSFHFLKFFLKCKIMVLKTASSLQSEPASLCRSHCHQHHRLPQLQVSYKCPTSYLSKCPVTVSSECVFGMNKWKNITYYKILIQKYSMYRIH